MNSEASEAPDLRDYLRLALRRGWIMVLCIVLIPLAVYQYTNSKPKVFESTTVLQVQPGVDQGDLTSPSFVPGDANLELVAAIVSTSAVANEAARLLGMPPGSLRGAAKASADPDTGFITIRAEAPTSQRAREVATAFADALSATRRNESIERIDAAAESVRESLAETPQGDAAARLALRSQLQRLETLRQAQTQNARVVEPASPGAQIAPNPKRNATLALVLAILVGAALIAVAERLDRRVHKPEDLERLTGLPFLATIPHEAFPGDDDTAEVHESFQTLRSALTYFNADKAIETLLVVSALKGEGKTTVATKLAEAFASSGKRVVLVDADLRKPDAAARLGVGENVGLSQVLAGASRLDDSLRDVGRHGHALRVLPAGDIPPNTSALLGSLRMSSLVDELTADSDLVVIDSTPLLAVSDAFSLLDKVDGIVVLVRLDKTPREAIKRMLQIIDSAGGSVLGIVATDGKRMARGYGYGYGAGYGYGDRRGRKADADANGAQPLEERSPAPSERT